MAATVVLESKADADLCHVLVTVAVCTRNRAADLQRCLGALSQLTYPRLDVVVVDNAPDDTTTAEVVRAYPTVRYVLEPRPGLDWARNRAVMECRGDIIAFTDDDVVVDANWVTAIARTFDADSSVMAVTGLVVPLELDTPAQRLFEQYGGFGRGLQRRWFRARPGRPAALEFGGAGAFGTGANMAYRRRVFDDIGAFDPALDVGTCTNGGGDLEMFFRVLKHGHTLVYEPAAVVRHRHRRDYQALRTQIRNNGIGFYAYLTRTALAYPDERVAIARLGTWWFRWWSVRRLVKRLLGFERLPLDLIWVELVGSLRGPFRYQPARAAAARIATAHADQPLLPVSPRIAPPATPLGEREAVRVIDLAEPLRAITDIGDCRRVHVFVFSRNRPVGRVELDNRGRDVSAAELQDAIASRLTLAALFPAPPPAPTATTEPRVTVIVATRDRPDDLRTCLESLTRQNTRHSLEIVVVDNNPASGATAQVAADFPTVRLVAETRPGLSYARNRGILAARGDIIVMTDDDVVAPETWIERLVAPFARPEVAVVTGNVLPRELDKRAQQLFEMYGGLGRGYQPAEYNLRWLRRCRRSVPTWEIGCTANAAFRASIFRDPRIGLLDEALGAGTPTGCSEDTWLFYAVLKADLSIAYEPHAYVWHCHRRTLEALRHQLYSYSKGHAAYQVATLLKYGDWRALIRLGVELPVNWVRRIGLRLMRRSDYPLQFIALEILGTVAGPWALWRSRRRVRTLGRSAVIEAPPAADAARFA